MTLGEAVFWFYVTFATTASTCQLIYFAVQGIRQHLLDARAGQQRRTSERWTLPAGAFGPDLTEEQRMENLFKEKYSK